MTFCADCSSQSSRCPGLQQSTSAAAIHANYGKRWTNNCWICCSHLDSRMQDKISAEDLAACFSGRVGLYNVRASITASQHRLSSLSVRCPPCRLLSQSLSINSAAAHGHSVQIVLSWSRPKLVSSFIAPVICNLCNLSLQTGIFTGNSEICVGQVIPVAKRPHLAPRFQTTTVLF